MPVRSKKGRAQTVSLDCSQLTITRAHLVLKVGHGDGAAARGELDDDVVRAEMDADEDRAADHDGGSRWSARVPVC